MSDLNLNNYLVLDYYFSKLRALYKRKPIETEWEFNESWPNNLLIQQFPFGSITNEERWVRTDRSCGIPNIFSWNL